MPTLLLSTPVDVPLAASSALPASAPPVVEARAEVVLLEQPPPDLLPSPLDMQPRVSPEQGGGSPPVAGTPPNSRDSLGSAPLPGAPPALPPLLGALFKKREIPRAPTEKIRSDIAALVTNGVAPPVAAGICKIPRHTFASWMAKGRDQKGRPRPGPFGDLVIELQIAEDIHEGLLLSRWTDLAQKGDYQAARALLLARYPERYAHLLPSARGGGASGDLPSGGAAPPASGAPAIRLFLPAEIAPPAPGPRPAGSPAPAPTGANGRAHHPTEPTVEDDLEADMDDVDDLDPVDDLDDGAEDGDPA